MQRWPVLCYTSLQHSEGNGGWRAASGIPDNRSFSTRMTRLRSYWLCIASGVSLWGSDPAVTGRTRYFRGDFDGAAASFELAIKQNPKSSELYHWLGKARGRQAEQKNFLQAPFLAVKCRAALEKSVDLDSGNILALNDLFAFYMDAPSILGGGLNSAKKAAAHIARLSAAEGHWAQAQLAERSRNWSEAEFRYIRASEAEPMDPGRKIDVAAFLARRGRFQDSDEWFRRAAALDPAHRLLPFEWAKAYVLSGREPVKAQQMLRRYLESGPTPDEPSRQEAEQLLRRLRGS
jgi:tetratricopeptide (TPR) repeat protein